MQCPDCGSGRRSDGYNRDGWYWLGCDRRFYPETHQYSPPNSRCRLYQLKREYNALNQQWAIRYRSLAQELALAYDDKGEAWRGYIPETIADEIDALLMEEKEDAMS